MGVVTPLVVGRAHLVGSCMVVWLFTSIDLICFWVNVGSYTVIPYTDHMGKSGTCKILSLLQERERRHGQTAWMHARLQGYVMMEL